MEDARQVRFWLAMVAAALMVQSCAQGPPAGPTARVYAADMAGAARSCTVPQVTPAAGRQTDVAMKVGNNGGWCAITVNNGGRPFDAGLLTSPPARGKVLIHTVGDNTRIDYTPDTRFTGTDSFTVSLLPGNATIRATVSVTP
jgi:hypothetical protein